MNKVSIFSIAALAVAVYMLYSAVTQRHEYAWYDTLRWIVCAACALAAYDHHTCARDWAAWVLGIIAVVFNPVVPFHSHRDTWQNIDKAAMTVCIVSIVATVKDLFTRRQLS